MNIPESASGQAVTVLGLGTFSFQCVNAGFKNLRGKITLPTLNQSDLVQSQVVVTTNVNGGSTLYTGLAGQEGFETGAEMSVGDVLNVILTSSLQADNGINAVKTTISFF